MADVTTVDVGLLCQGRLGIDAVVLQVDAGSLPRARLGFDGVSPLAEYGSLSRGRIGCDTVVTVKRATRFVPSGREPNLPAGGYYDGQSRDWRLGTVGQVMGVHPVDEGMALSILNCQGDIKSSPTTGHTLNKIQYLGASDMEQDVRSRVLAANPLSRIVAAGDAVVTSIKPLIQDNRLVVIVYYRNLRDTDPRSSTSHDKELTWYG